MRLLFKILIFLFTCNVLQSSANNGSARTAQLTYLDVQTDGKVVMNQLDFTDDINSIDKVIMHLDNANFFNESSQLVNQSKLSIVLTKTGAVKVVHLTVIEDYYLKWPLTVL